MDGRRRLGAKLAGAAALVALAEVLADGSVVGAVIGGFAGAWLLALIAVRPAILNNRAGAIAASVAALLVPILVDNPGPLAWLLFGTAITLAALFPRRGFDDALHWAKRIGWHALTGIAAPIRDWAQVTAAAARRRPARGGVRAAVAALSLPLVGGGVFLALFADANPLIGDLFARIAILDTTTLAWRSAYAVVVLVPVWASLRPAASVTAIARAADRRPRIGVDPGVATLLASLVTFNAIFALENGLDIAFLWSGAALPAGVTMADYAHRGAYSLIVTALLAGGFVIVALRPGGPGAASAAVRRLVTLWIAQNLLLVASSIRRTLDYVDAYGMTVLRLAALAWMALVATGLALIGWRLVRGKSAAWLINANALVAAAVLIAASVVDLGAVAAAWNVRVALAEGQAGPRLDLRYLSDLGPSSLVPLATLEAHARGRLRRRLGPLRSTIQADLAARQGNWRSWTWRNARRLAATAAMLGAPQSGLRTTADGRGYDGASGRPPASPPATTPLTTGPQR